MNHFIHEDFLLETETARDLYHRFAKAQPILDYHCHLSPQEVAQNRAFRSMTELWLGGDHYKWRAMRTAGVSEHYCTGAASDWEKFRAWAETVPKTLRNPLYHWTHLELAFPFGIRDRLLDGTTAASIYAECNARLQEDAFRAQGLLAQFNVVAVCTTDDPVDSLVHHVASREQPGSSTRLLPTWRPDRAIAVEDVAAYNCWLDQLASVANVDIVKRSDLLQALGQRHAFFHEVGCRLSDHGVDTMFDAPCSSVAGDRCFDKLRRREPLDTGEALGFKSLLLYELALMDHERGWAQQFHIGALRDNNSRLRAKLGPNTGFDSIGDDAQARPLARFLDRLDQSDRLAKTVLYNSNPRDNELMATMIGNFQDGSVAGKLQFGSAWWFLDQLDGMQRQLNAVSNMSLLHCFVGMLTDSRSFLSYSRHDYFRRLLCNLLGDEIERGLLPSDRELIGNLVRRVCFENARDYFQLGVR
ncbi:MAG TPA: glucuronate isomerase [Polyangiaceae bacterium]